MIDPDSGKTSRPRKSILIGIVGVPNGVLGGVAVCILISGLVQQITSPVPFASPLKFGLSFGAFTFGTWLSYGYLQALFVDTTPLLSWRCFWNLSATANALLVIGVVIQLVRLFLVGQSLRWAGGLLGVAWPLTVCILSFVIGNVYQGGDP